MVNYFGQMTTLAKAAMSGPFDKIFDNSSCQSDQ